MCKFLHSIQSLSPLTPNCLLYILPSPSLLPFLPATIKCLSPYPPFIVHGPTQTQSARCVVCVFVCVSVLHLNQESFPTTPNCLLYIYPSLPFPPFPFFSLQLRSSVQVPIPHSPCTDPHRALLHRHHRAAVQCVCHGPPLRRGQTQL